MNQYKSTYCPIQQYMPNTFQKWGLKVWCLTCLTLKYVWNFKIYCRKENLLPQVEDPIGLANCSVHTICCRELKLTHNVVLKMVDGLANLDYLVVMNNFFSSIRLFMEVLSIGIYVARTLRLNRVGLLMDSKDTKCFKNWTQNASRI